MAKRMSAMLEEELAAIDAALDQPSWRSPRALPIVRFRADLAATRFHLNRPAQGAAPAIVAILGGTGTGKSTLVNRLIGGNIAEANFRRTFTAGAIAVASDASRIPSQWLGVEHHLIDSSQLPARGQADQLTIAQIAGNELIQKVTLVDTPDLDGDQPAHHAQAERVFRWADAVVFVVTPEKYQMTELLAYYRLARRYELPALFVMNKAEEQAVVDDYASQMENESVFAIPRDDAAYEPPQPQRLEALRETIGGMTVQEHTQGTALRIADLADRLRDQIIEPARNQRREIDRLIGSLRAMETPTPGVDVNPLTEQLQRRLQQRSVLYLMGPARVLDRVRQVPGILARLPRSTWLWLRTGKFDGNGDETIPPDLMRDRPNFNQVLMDQFVIVQSRLDDLIRPNPAGQKWIEQNPNEYADSKLNPALAGQIADEEIANLQKWLESQWNATPRDTAVIEKLLKILPGGQKLSKWSEAAPYLLTIVVATHHAFFGHIDLLILGGWSLATWLTEKLSNQVAARTRATNAAITSRFSEMAHRQIERTCAWLMKLAPTTKEIERLASLTDQVSEGVQHFSPTSQSPGKGIMVAND